MAADGSAWFLSNRADPRANAVAKRHYTVQSPDSAQFVPPGRCVVLRTHDYGALWVTSWPLAEFTKHAWAGAWVCSLFRNESREVLSSELIRQAVAVTRWMWTDVPLLGIVTFVNEGLTRRKRDPGRCYRRAGWSPCGATKGGLVALQLLPDAMPAPLAPMVYQPSLLEAV